MEAEKSKRKPVVDINAGLFIACFYTIIQLVSDSRSPTSRSIQILQDLTAFFPGCICVTCFLVFAIGSLFLL